MNQVLITISKGIIEQVVFFDDPKLALQALSNYVKGMNVENDDAAVYDCDGLVANAKHFLDDQDEYMGNKGLIAEATENSSQPIYVIGNPEHRLGFMVVSPDDPLGYEDAVAALSDLGQWRKNCGMHLKLYRVVPVNWPVADRPDLEKYNAESEVDNFDYGLVQEHLIDP